MISLASTCLNWLAKSSRTAPSSSPVPNRYFNDGEKVFKRPTTAIGRDVYSCHPPKVEPIVRGIIDSFRKGDRDNVAVWLEKQGRPFYVNYMAVRDQHNNYIGTLELVQDMHFAKEHFGRSK